jgi:hypothetical protein
MVAEEVAASGWSDDLGSQLEDVDGPGMSALAAGAGSPMKGGGESDGDVGGCGGGDPSRKDAAHHRVSGVRDGGAVSVARRRQRLEAVRGREVRALAGTVQAESSCDP